MLVSLTPMLQNLFKFFKRISNHHQQHRNRFAFKGLIKKDDSAINVTNMNAKIGKIDANGLLAVDNSSSVPSIKADLTFGTLDTQALMSGKTSKASSGVGKSSSSTSSSTTKSGAAPWTRDAIDTSVLRSVNLELDAKAQKVGSWNMGN